MIVFCCYNYVCIKSVLNDYIKHSFLMYLHILRIPFHTRFSVNFIVEHGSVIILANLHHNLKFK